MDEEKINELEEIFNPKSVAIVGASSSMKFGSFFLSSLKGYGFEGALYPVNPKETEISGLKSYPSVKDIPEEVDFVGISVPAKYVPGVMQDCAEKGVKAVEIFSSGFSELGEDGNSLEEEIVKIAKDGGFRIIGPNCFGIYSPSSRLTLLPGYDFSKESGPVSFIGQSGGYSADICVRAKGWGINFSKVISYGNACDLNETDFIEYFGCNPETKIISAYIEGVRGSRFFEVVRDVSKKKPVIIWKGGLTKSGARAVASHTGSLGGEEILWKAVFKQTGAIQVNSLEEIIDTILAFLHLPTNCGRNVTILGGGGGIGVAAADACEREGLNLPIFDSDVQNKLRALLPPVGNSVRNPIDMGGPIAPPGMFKKMMEIAGENPNVDVIILDQSVHYMSLMGAGILRKLPKIAAKIMESYKKPVIAVLRSTPTEVDLLKTEAEWRKTRDRYLAENIPVYPSLERAASALNKVISYGEYINKLSS